MAGVLEAKQCAVSDGIDKFDLGVSMQYWKKVSRLYCSTALMLWNIFIALVIVNLLLWVVFFVTGSLSVSEGTNAFIEKYGMSKLKQVYPKLSEKQITDLLNETWSRPYVFEPYVQLKERPFSGISVNVDGNGFRMIDNQGPWPLDPDSFNIFLFGGSTAFGYGVSDNETIAAYLQECLLDKMSSQVRVYNFGRGHYYSTQERILFEQLLTSGAVPDMAIFIDGLNEFYFSINEPHFTSRFRKFVDGACTPPKWISQLPMNRAARAIKRKIRHVTTKKKKKRECDSKNIAGGEDRYQNDPVRTASIVERYLKNKKLIEAAGIAFGVQPIFVWQPVPTYNYNDRNHVFADAGYREHIFSRYGYEYMAKYTKSNYLGKHFLWCADIQSGLKEPLYVDLAHYGSTLSKKLAETIVEFLIRRDLIKQE